MTFANSNIENLIVNWCVDSEFTRSDHEIIRFDLLTDLRLNLSNQKAIEISHHYNVEKADWKKFDQYLQNQEQLIQIDLMQLLSSESITAQMNSAAQKFQNFLQNATDKFISKSKICAKSKR